MENVALKIEKRELIGGRKVKKLRDKGFIPAVVYGKGMEPVPAAVRLPEFRESLSQKGKTAIFELALGDDKPFPAIIKEIQYDSVKKSYLHVDFQRISLTEKIKTMVPVKVTGSVQGAVISQLMDEVEVECLPLDTPAHIEVNVSGLEAGDHITAGDLKLPEKVALLTEPEVVIVSITEPRAASAEESADEPATGGAGGES